MPTDDTDLAALIEAYKLRRDIHGQEKATTLRIHAACRRIVGGDKTEAKKLYTCLTGKGEHLLASHAMALTAPLFEIASFAAAQRACVEKRIRKMVKPLPIWNGFAKDISGVGEMLTAAVIAETGGLHLYSNPAKVWKRMGLAVMPDGGRQRRIAGVDAIAHGYNAERRAVVWNIGECLLKAQIRRDENDPDSRIAIGPYGQVYLDRKAYEFERDSELSPAKAHARAKRYMEKRLLREMWKAWRDLDLSAPVDAETKSARQGLVKRIAEAAKAAVVCYPEAGPEDCVAIERAAHGRILSYVAATTGFPVSRCRPEFMTSDQCAAASEAIDAMDYAAVREAAKVAAE